MTDVGGKMPMVSICFPVRNGGQHLVAVLRSVSEQTEQDFEIIVSNNNSDDGSSEFLRSAAATAVAHDNTRDVVFVAFLVAALECHLETVQARRSKLICPAVSQ